MGGKIDTRTALLRLRRAADALAKAAAAQSDLIGHILRGDGPAEAEYNRVGVLVGESFEAWETASRIVADTVTPTRP